MKKLILLGIAMHIAGLLPCNAQAKSRDIVKEQQYTAQLRAIDSSAVIFFTKGTAEMDAGNNAAADSLYSIVYTKAPDFEPVIRRLGYIKAQEGKNKEGIDLCEKAVALNRCSDNILMLVSCLIIPEPGNEKPPGLNMLHALELIKEGKSLNSDNNFEFTFLQAQANLILNDNSAFASATHELMKFYPDQMLSHYFNAILAVQNENWEEAESEILVAQKMGLPEEDAKSFLDSGVSSKAASGRYKKIFLDVLLTWACGFVVLFIVGLILSNYTLRALEREFSSGDAKKQSPVLRKIYKFLINAAGIYYYISLPIILVLVLALVAGVFYLFFALGRLPLQLMFVIGIGGLVTVYSMIRALLTKTKHADPGRELKEEEAPELFAMTREVAATMNTRPIDEIRLTPDADLAVYERGSWKDKLGDKSKRILILGAGIIKDFKADDFRAVLAHEYGHFAHRDTAGGAVALQVRNDMRKYMYALYLNQQTVWWNLAFQFLRLYDFIFRRISNGSTRLQEILADRVAAEHYGAPVFKNGLSYVIKRNIEFATLAKAEIEKARSVKRPFHNLYELTTTSTSEIEEEFQKTLTRKTSRDDTHPSPVDRFRFIEGLGEGKNGSENRYVRELFADWNSITTEMTTFVEEGWKKAD